MLGPRSNITLRHTVTFEHLPRYHPGAGDQPEPGIVAGVIGVPSNSPPTRSFTRNLSARMISIDATFFHGTNPLPNTSTFSPNHWVTLKLSGIGRLLGLAQGDGVISHRQTLMVKAILAEIDTTYTEIFSLFEQLAKRRKARIALGGEGGDLLQKIGSTGHQAGVGLSLGNIDA